MSFFRTKTPYISPNIDVNDIKLDAREMDNIKKWFAENPNKNCYSVPAYNVIKLKDKERYIVYSKKTFLENGSAGNVYMAYDATQSSFVALKIYKSTPKEKISQKLNRLSAEINALRKATDATSDQAYSALIHNAEDKLTPITIMPLEEGQDLNNTSSFRLPPERLIQLAINICSEVKKLHAKKILHRDIKTENIMANHFNGNTKIIDYELSVECGESLEYIDSEFHGTPPYYALNIKLSENTYKYTSKSDIHALAVTLGRLFYIIGGESDKFDSQSNDAKFFLPNDELRAEFANLIRSMMATEIEEGDILQSPPELTENDSKKDSSSMAPPKSKDSCSLDAALLKLNELRSRFFPQFSCNMKQTVLLHLNEFPPDSWSNLLEILKKGAFKEIQFIVTDEKSRDHKNTDDNIAAFRRYLESHKLTVGKAMHKGENPATVLRRFMITQHHKEQNNHETKTEARYKTQIPRSYFLVSKNNKLLLTAAQSGVYPIRSDVAINLDKINAHVDSHRISEHQAEFSIIPFQAEIDRLIKAYGRNNDEKTVTNAVVIRRISMIKTWIAELRSDKRPTYANIKSKLSDLQSQMKRTKLSFLSSIFKSKGAKNIEEISQRVLSSISRPVS